MVITPLAIGREALRLVKATHEAAGTAAPLDLRGTVMVSLLGAVFSFLAGLLALRWLSGWLESGKWYLFGIYCIVASGVVLYLYHLNF